MLPAVRSAFCEKCRFYRANVSPQFAERFMNAIRPHRTQDCKEARYGKCPPKAICLQLAATLKAVISQRLVRRADNKGRVPAVEVMIATADIRDCIINPDKTRLIHDAIAAGTSQYGMQTFDQSLYDLFTRNLITFEEALLRALCRTISACASRAFSAADAAREEMEHTMNEYDRMARR